VYILTERNFIALSDLSNAECYNRNMLSDSRAVADAARSGNYYARRACQTYENQVRALPLSTLSSIPLVSRDCHAITVRLEQLFNAVAGFVNILDHQDQRSGIVTIVHLAEVAGIQIIFPRF
jgi:hypothetical protein